MLLLVLLGKSSIAKEAWHAGSRVVQSTDESTIHSGEHGMSDKSSTGRLRQMAAAMQQCTRAPILQLER